MEDKGSKNVLDLYLKANQNKNDSIIEGYDDRDFSEAEVVVLSCLAIIARQAEYSKIPSDIDYEKIIKTLIISSLDGMTDNLRKKEEYDKIIKSYVDKDVETYGATVVYKSMVDSFRNFLDPVYIEEEFVNENLKLHELSRKGHVYWGVNSSRVESILEHIYGCLVLAIGIESEYDYKIDYNKLIKMLLIHETGEIVIGDLTEWDISKEEKDRIEREAVVNILSKLYGGQKLIDLFDEFNCKTTIEAEYANLIDKLEYDMQVKVYDSMGLYDFSNYPKNVVTQSPIVQDIINNGAASVFDVHYEYDKNRYNRLPCMRRILEEAKKL